MKQITWCTRIATLGPIGYLPAPGTMATLVTLPLVYCMRLLLSEWGYLGSIAVATVIGLHVIGKALPAFNGDVDPSAIVFDELIGCLITFIAVPLSLWFLVIGFCLFRFFDISKWCGINYFERIPGALGIVADDVVAALYSLLLLLGLTQCGVLYHYVF